MRHSLASLVVCLPLLAAAPGSAGANDFPIGGVIGLGTRIVGDIQRQQARADAAERRRIAAEEEAARVAELKRTKEGRRQLAREEAERKKRERAARALIGAVGASIIGGSGNSNDDSNYNGTGMTKDQYIDEVNRRNWERQCAYSGGC